MGERGILTDDLLIKSGEIYIMTEKVDGTNCRVIMFPDGTYFIGSREELLTFRDDVIWNPSQDIVENLKPMVQNGRFGPYFGTLTVWYCELYGGKIGKGAKQYTSKREFGVRLFDVMQMPIDEFNVRVSDAPEVLASWRQNGGQRFLDEVDLHSAAEHGRVELTPRLKWGKQVPTDHVGVLEMMRAMLQHTGVALDDDAHGRAEGLVLRTDDRSCIVKARFEDYERTLKKRKTKARES
jgi:hypothetical protein